MTSRSRASLHLAISGAHPQIRDRKAALQAPVSGRHEKGPPHDRLGCLQKKRNNRPKDLRRHHQPADI